MGRCYDGAMGERITTVAFVSLLLCGCPAVDDDTTGDDDTTDDDTTADDDTTGDDDTGDDDTGDDDTVVDPGCAYEELWGKFGLTSDLYGGSLSGVYHDDASPMVPDVLVDDGVCVLYGYDPMPVCEPHCTPPDLCGPDEQCHSWPEALDVGTLTVPETSPPLSLCRASRTSTTRIRSTRSCTRSATCCTCSSPAAARSGSSAWGRSAWRRSRRGTSSSSSTGGRTWS